MYIRSTYSQTLTENYLNTVVSDAPIPILVLASVLFLAILVCIGNTINIRY